MMINFKIVMHLETKEFELGICFKNLITCRDVCGDIFKRQFIFKSQFIWKQTK
ncbi:hypothetical protein MAR_031453 [Mya arenaria]|uniref:Uncharacterized protein n=1 Tax=Mya arenaria TaxID=6604 RepID=A0ABY7F665_MYAAR|nr:hypothetical protein MAR_031453 [Mya arenaria]